jgi:hypothetical protein
MKRHDYLIPFSRFHRSLLFLALIAKENAPKVKGYPEEIGDKMNYALTFYENDIIPHFQEEKIKVFNRFKGRSDKLDNIIRELENERLELTSLFDELDKDRNNEVLFYRIGLLLEQHVRKEERQLFQTIQEVAADELDFLYLKSSQS